MHDKNLAISFNFDMLSDKWPEFKTEKNLRTILHCMPALLVLFSVLEHMTMAID